MLSIVVSVSTNILWPAITGYIVDVFVVIENKKEAWSSLRDPLILASVLWLGMEFLQRIRGLVIGIVFPRFEAAIRSYSFETVLQHPNDFFKKKQSGSVAYRIDDMPRSSRMIVDISITIFMPLIVCILLSSILLFKMHWTLSLIFALWLALYGCVMIVYCLQGVNLAMMQSSARSDVQSTVTDIIRNQANVRAFNGFSPERQILYRTQKNELNIYRKVVFYVEKSKFFLGLLSAASVGVMLTQAIALWAAESITTGDIVFMISTVLNIVSMMWYAIDELNYLLADIGVTKKSIDIISGREVLRSAVSEKGLTTRDTPKEELLSLSKGEICFDNVSFGYDPENRLFEEMNVLIAGKEKVALVGFSGSGKTSFVNMIMRLYDPDAGSVLIDGHDIKEMDLSFLRDNVSFIQQEPILFNRSIMANIRYGRHDASDQEVFDAAIKSNCHNFISKLPNGYDSMVGEGGSYLSGGERQRLALARAFLKDAPILIMDEPTASQDIVTERELQKSMKSLMVDRTVLVIAHRLATTTPLVDRIMVFDEGKIIEDGSHKELLELNGYYAKLWQMQKDGLFSESEL